MRLNHKLKTLGMLVLGLVLLAPMGYAQIWRDRDDRDDRNGDWRHGRNNTNYAMERGYQDGLRQGQFDRSRRGNQTYRNNRDWQRGDRGYEKSMGAKGQYKKAYREGYERGYQDAIYGRNANGGWNDDRGRRSRRDGYPNTGYPNSGYPNGNGGYNANALVQSAQRNGFQSGAHYAEMDRSRGHAYNPTGAKGYRDADQGYDDSLGSKSDFQRIFRENFVRGYQQAYGNIGYRR